MVSKVQFKTLKVLIGEGPVTLCVTGDCMNGIAADSNVRLERKHFYWPGDIVAFRRAGDSIVSHRFLGYIPGRRGWRAITRADSADSVDAPVLTQNILGHVSQVDGQRYRPVLADRLGSVAKFWLAISRYLVKWIGNHKSVARFVG